MKKAIGLVLMVGGCLGLLHEKAKYETRVEQNSIYRTETQQNLERNGVVEMPITAPACYSLVALSGTMLTFSGYNFSRKKKD